jgi:hypothetical protein
LGGGLPIGKWDGGVADGRRHFAVHTASVDPPGENKTFGDDWPESDVEEVDNAKDVLGETDKEYKEWVCGNAE